MKKRLQNPFKLQTKKTNIENANIISRYPITYDNRILKNVFVLFR